MGWIMPRELLQGIGKDLHRVAPEHEGERIAPIKDRAESHIEANQDMAVDGPSRGCWGSLPTTAPCFQERFQTGT